MAKNLSDIKNLVNDKLRDSGMSSDNTDQVLRAINLALGQVNAGDTGEKNQPQVGYDFQKEYQDVDYDNEITGTADAGGSSTVLIDASSTFVTDGVSVGDTVENSTDVSVARVVSVDSETQITTTALKNGTDNTFSSGDSFKIKSYNYKINSTWNLKFPTLLRLAQDHNQYFSYVTPEYFERKKYITGSGERMFTIEYINGTQVLIISHDTAENMNLVFFSTNMVLDDGGSTRRDYFDGNSDSDTILIPDRFIDVPVTLAVAELVGQKKGYDDTERKEILAEGRTKLKSMIASIGYYQIKPIERLATRSEWPRTITRISEE
jgi:hypothetical protein